MFSRSRYCVAMLLAIACSAARADTYVIVIEAMRFSPASVIVKRGDHVVWENKDLFPHTATSNTNAFDTEDLASEATWTYVAEKPGEYVYHCAYHPTMTAKLIVR